MRARSRNMDPVIASIEKRLALWTHLPVSYQEDMQVRMRAGRAGPMERAPLPARRNAAAETAACHTARGPSSLAGLHTLHRAARVRCRPPPHCRARAPPPLQVLRYGPTNKYSAHLDGLNRVATVLIYLVAPEEGGETAFPHAAPWLHPEMGAPTQGSFSDCANGTVAFKPRRGDALLFYDLLPNYKTMDQASTHTGCECARARVWGGGVQALDPAPLSRMEACVLRV